ncbi:MAG: response regulator [Sulfuritalea sp.]|nr:response regulator [Sulfuritalea sp.]
MDANPLYQVMIVDDEASIVNAVRRELSTPPLGHYRYEVEGFTEPAAALERAKTKKFDAVISDYRMPGMDGLEFLKALAALQPECARLVLSGQTDMDSLIRMVNETHIYRFIPKPWHDHFLKSSLSQAIAYAGVVTENKRLADLVRERGIPISALDDGAVDQILIVDDDPGILASLSRILTRHGRVDDLFAAIQSEVAHHERPLLDETRVSVQITPSPRHALRMAKELNFSCIIADYRMPEMNGVELLQKFADEQPDCARLLISGAISQEELIIAVDMAHIFGFINKPWQDFELKLNIAQALTWRRMQRENRALAEMVNAAEAGHTAVAPP